jgi:hypothetical protein
MFAESRQLKAELVPLNEEDACPAQPQDGWHSPGSNTGLDMVLEITLGGEVIRDWRVCDSDSWSRFPGQRQLDHEWVQASPSDSNKLLRPREGRVSYLDGPGALRLEGRIQSPCIRR